MNARSVCCAPLWRTVLFGASMFLGGYLSVAVFPVWLAVVFFSSGLLMAVFLQRCTLARQRAGFATLIADVERGGPGHLQHRLSVDTLPAQFKELALACNDLFARLDQSITRTLQFSAVASHELRTPLTILRGEVEIALRQPGLSEDIQALLVSNLEEIQRMSRIIEDLLLLSKGDVGEMPLRKESLELNELLTEIFSQAAVLGDAKDIAVSFSPFEGQVPYRGDGLRLRQMFLNLLANAVNYTDAGGTVDMSLIVEDRNAMIVIRDTGIGMKSEHLPHIFDRFYRIDKEKNCGDGGSGLGLSIVKWVVDAHGGTISVTSEYGKGTAFAVTLPLSSS